MLEISVLESKGLFYLYVAKTKALISFAVTAKLICVFVFAFAKSWFSHDAAHIMFANIYNDLPPALVDQYLGWERKLYLYLFLHLFVLWVTFSSC